MKSNLILFIILLIIVELGCSHHIEQQNNSYIPPIVKNQPRLIYPKDAQENFYSGNSKVIMIVTKTGTVDKLYVEKTSGYEVLDGAALDFCKNLVFSPAIRNGEAVDARVEWEIKFNFTDKNLEARNYLLKLDYLLRKVNNSSAEERNKIEKEIFEKHNEFVANMKDGLNFNIIIAQVVTPSLTEEWSKDWNAFPLSFLLYHDFIQRFQDFDSLPAVKRHLYNALKFDVQYIKNTPSNSSKAQYEKQNILRKIKNFISKEYPDFVLDELGLDNKVISANVVVAVCQNK